MGVKLVSASAGSVEIVAPATASNYTLTVPAATGTAVIQNGSSNLLMNSGYGSDAVAYGCRAWVNFNGTGTVAIRASGNVSSITDNAVGDYTVNFTTALADANYSVVVSCTMGTSASRSDGIGIQSDTAAPTTSAVRLLLQKSDGTDADQAYVFVSVFR